MRGRSKALAVVGFSMFAVCGCGAYAGRSAPPMYKAYREAALEQVEELRAGALGAAATPAVSASMLLAQVSGPDDDGRINVQSPGARLVVYSAAIQMVVARIAETLDGIAAVAGGLGGYVQSLEANVITVKVPAGRFDEAVNAVAKLGEVTGRAMKSADVTDTVRDYRIRLSNAENVRERLVKLLDKCDTVEDALKVEKELARVTEEIELLKGRLQQMEHSLAFSTITVSLNSPIPQVRTKRHSPFNWVNSLGSVIEDGMHAYPSKGRPPMRFRLPENYVLFRRGSDTAAVSADGVSLLVQKRDNYEGGSLDFWSRLVRRQLVEQRCVSIAAEKGLQLVTKVPANLFAGMKIIAGEEIGYAVGVAVNRSFVYVFEAWGPAAALEKDMEKIEESVQSLRVPR